MSRDWFTAYRDWFTVYRDWFTAYRDWFTVYRDTRARAGPAEASRGQQRPG